MFRATVAYLVLHITMMACIIIPSVSVLPNAPVLRATEQWANSRQALQRQRPVIEGLRVGKPFPARRSMEHPAMGAWLRHLHEMAAL